MEDTSKWPSEIPESFKLFIQQLVDSKVEEKVKDI
jgi:hypothetical protein